MCNAKIDICIPKCTSDFKIENKTENIRVYFALKTKPASRNKIENFLSLQKNILFLHKIEFGFDFLCEGIFADCGDAESFFMTLFSNFKILEFDKYYVLETKSVNDTRNDPHSIVNGNSIVNDIVKKRNITKVGTNETN